MPNIFDCPVCGAEIETVVDEQTVVAKSVEEEASKENHIGFKGKMILDGDGFIAVNYDNIVKISFIQGKMYVGNPLFWAEKGKIDIEINHGDRRSELTGDFDVDVGSLDDSLLAEFFHDGLRLDNKINLLILIGPVCTRITAMVDVPLLEATLANFNSWAGTAKIFNKTFGPGNPTWGSVLNKASYQTIYEK